MCLCAEGFWCDGVGVCDGGRCVCVRRVSGVMWVAVGGSLV